VLEDEDGRKRPVSFGRLCRLSGRSFRQSIDVRLRPVEDISESRFSLEVSRVDRSSGRRMLTLLGAAVIASGVIGLDVSIERKFI
jgi:hypothetical protein